MFKEKQPARTLLKALRIKRGSKDLHCRTSTLQGEALTAQNAEAEVWNAIRPNPNQLKAGAYTACPLLVSPSIYKNTDVEAKRLRDQKGFFLPEQQHRWN